jgi:hypothetical protein
MSFVCNPGTSTSEDEVAEMVRLGKPSNALEAAISWRGCGSLATQHGGTEHVPEIDVLIGCILAERIDISDGPNQSEPRLYTS